MSEPDGPNANAPRTIALMNQKGGVGKTTTTVNLAAALAQRGERVLVVDLDPQAHLTLHLGLDPADLEHTLYDLLTDAALSAEAVIQQAEQKLDVIPAEVDLAAAEQELRDASDRQARLKHALAPIADRYSFILFDCPPSLGLLTLNALAAATEVIVPMQAHFLALQGLSKLLETVQLVRQNVNTSLQVSGVVLAMHEGQTNLAGEVVVDLEQFFQASRKLAMPWSNAVIYQPAVRRNIKLAECPSFGQTIFQYAPHCAGAYDYAELASAIAGPALEVNGVHAAEVSESPTPESPTEPPGPPAGPGEDAAGSDAPANESVGGAAGSRAPDSEHRSHGPGDDVVSDTAPLPHEPYQDGPAG